MDYGISENYSFLNNYEYEGKPAFMSTLDWLSMPCRKILGGRDIYVLSQSYGHQLRNADRVTTLFMGVLLLPAAVVSIASLIAKLATCPFVWEKRQVKVQSDRVWKVLNQFNQEFAEGRYNQAVQTLTQRPELKVRDDVQENLFNIILDRVNEGTAWEELHNLMPLVHVDNAIRLIDHAVKTKLAQDDFNPLTEAEHIENFIQSSLRHTNRASLEKCYKHVICNALLPNISRDNVVVCAYKDDLADRMIQSLEQAMLSRSSDELFRAQAGLAVECLRYAHTSNALGSRITWLPSDEKKREEVRVAIQAVRDVSQMGLSMLGRLQARLLKSNISPRLQVQAIIEELQAFDRRLGEFALSADEDKQQYVQGVQRRARTLMASVFSPMTEESLEKMGLWIEMIQKVKDEESEVTAKHLEELEKVTPIHSVKNLLAFLRWQEMIVLRNSTGEIMLFVCNYLLQMALDKGGEGMRRAHSISKPKP